AAVAAGLPIAWSVLRFAVSARRRDILVRLAFPLAAAVASLVWILSAWKWTGGHWAPLPWDIAGDWTVPADWPPAPIRWVLGLVTFALLLGGLAGSAVSLRQAIERSDLSTTRVALWGWRIEPLQSVRVPTIIVAGSIVVMALGVAGWGLLAERYAP